MDRAKISEGINEELLKNFIVETVEEMDRDDKDKIHLKGYMYDSLVYRYELALWKAYVSDIEPMMNRLHISKAEATAKVQDYYYRDLVRFCQILDEAIGERD